MKARADQRQRIDQLGVPARGDHRELSSPTDAGQRDRQLGVLGAHGPQPLDQVEVQPPRRSARGPDRARLPPSRGDRETTPCIPPRRATAPARDTSPRDSERRARPRPVRADGRPPARAARASGYPSDATNERTSDPASVIADLSTHERHRLERGRIDLDAEPGPVERASPAAVAEGQVVAGEVGGQDVPVVRALDVSQKPSTRLATCRPAAESSDVSPG